MTTITVPHESGKLSSRFINPPNLTSSKSKIPLERSLTKDPKISLSDVLTQFDDMLHTYPPPPVSSFNPLLITVAKDGSCKNHCLGEAEQLFETLEKSDYTLHIRNYNCLLDGLWKAEKHDSACELFERLRHLGMRPDSFTKCIMIHGFCMDGQLEKVNNLFLEMENNGFDPDVASFNELIRGLCENNDAATVVELLRKKG